jgi:hypothetical protein
VSRQRSDLKDKVANKASFEVMEHIRIRGEWPAADTTMQERLIVWDRFTILPIMDMMFSRIADVLDFEDIIGGYQVENEKMRAFTSVWFSGAMEMRWCMTHRRRDQQPTPSRR